MRNQAVVQHICQAEQPCGKRLGAHPAAVAAVLRAALECLFVAPEGGQTRWRPGSVGASASGPSGARSVRHQTGEFVALRNSDSDRHLGSEPTGVFGGRQCGPLWDELGGEFHLEFDLYGHFERLDRRWGGVEQGRRRRAGSHSRGGGALTLCVAGLRFGQRRGVSKPSLMVLHAGEKRSGGLYSFTALSLRRQRPCEQKNWTWAVNSGVWPAEDRS
jgi:hypothetical protein